MNTISIPHFPTADQIQLAVGRYLDKAYDRPPSGLRERFAVANDANVCEWLMQDEVEQQPEHVDVNAVQAFSLRMGNERYRYMKLRIARPPGKDFFVFTVDAHDAILTAPPGSPDEAELEELRRYNSRICHEIMEEWDRCGLFTERAYLRQEIQRARERNSQVR